MDSETAKEYLNNPTKGKPSDVGKAVDVLLKEYGTYKAISKEVPMSDKVLSERHRLFLLPEGIRWKIDEGEIGVGQGYQISRLDKEDDQWLLAFTIIEEKLSTKECEDVVTATLKQGRPLKEVLNSLSGVRLDKVQPLLLPLRFDLRLAISRVAWNKKQKWEDLCFKLIRQGLDIDVQQVASQLRKVAAELEKAEISEG